MKQGTLIKTGVLDYQTAWDLQKALHRDRVNKLAQDTLILTEHPHTYTLGKSGHEENLVAKESMLNQNGIQVFRIDRGGDITYHGPGQIVGYPILDLHDYYLDVHRFLRDLEDVLIQTLAEFDITAGRVEGLTGVWVDGAKIAAIGIKVSRWVTMHGFAFNVNTALKYFGNIIPCGISNKQVTSMEKILGARQNYADVRDRVAQKFSEIFDVELKEREFEEVDAA
ncbi:lipoyl(octanoyl) transferase LipB [candidate division KSB1 bacterium]|nr:lipoyl(octanoyl) transferase LipB [candidate division KSB1 bacterium]NIR71280.1 lipoyl(octanoyl) transferase LipB [candidate division KSB1 bacterium]NIS24809.1 lipoyl(octanoyl) transferase LipB [candidate division KSB1 bacterium]NIT71716.1 lipoyl(octanoyl) transferase LipB [candidate division KSB1 bacterium]NIU25445.1 lipoyl(octanoyl) transferase LipB [candidate division KSB1 bacterium]